MIAREALVAAVLAATDKVVQQANVGDWPAALQSSQDRRLLLEQLVNQEPQAGEHGFLRALRDAAAESEAALVTMSTSNPAQNGSVRSAKQGNVGGLLCTKA